MDERRAAGTAAPRAGGRPNPSFKEAANAWDRIEQAQKMIAQNAKHYNLLEAGHGFNSTLFGIARTLLRAAEEKPKPNKDRLREFGQAGLESLEFQLFSEEPIYDDFEQLKLANSLTWLATQLGYANAAGAEGSGGQVAARTRHRTGPGHQGQRRRVSQEALQGRPGRRRRSQGPDDRAGPADRSGSPSRAQDHRGPDRSQAAGPCPDRQSALRRRRHQHLSRRHLHAAPGLRRGERLRRRRASRSRSRRPSPASTSAPPSTTTSRPSICRRAGWNARTGST